MSLHTFTNRLTRRAAFTAGLLLLFAAFSAHAALVAYQVASKHDSSVSPRVAGWDAQDHFPGAALLYPSDELPAPAVGATGTTALPDLPIPADYDAAAVDASIRPARPFSLGGASTEARARAQQCLTAAIYYEAASESEDGQRAVAQVVLNRVRHPAFPGSVCGVVFQGSERTTGCQFSFACDGSMARQPSRTGWARAGRYAADSLSGRVFAPVGLATHYHTYAVTPSWNRSLVMTAAIGAHFFHRWQGWWGTPAAFSQGYRAAEPFPGPHARPVAPLTIDPKLTMASATSAPPQTTLPSLIQPAYADRSVAIAKPAVADVLPESTMLDRWKDTGKPLR
jgi:spore germination cell wall hydrolase CwlJ-like protein